MKVLIIEDEEPASLKLARLLKEIRPDIEIAGILKSVEQSINWLQENPEPDLIFMDIQLEDGICFEIFENIKIQIPVIFTTAFDEYSLRAFKVNSIDYLLKPVNIEELQRAIDKFDRLHYRSNHTKIESILNQLQPKTKERFLLKIGEHYRSVHTRDISCFYIKERCNFLHVDGRNYPVDFSLDKIELLIDPKLFFRISRNFIINLNFIQDIIAYSSSRLKIIIKNQSVDEDLIVSRERVKEFKDWMDR